MIIHMIDTRGRARIGEFVKRAIGWSRTSAVKLGDLPGSPKRQTIQRIVAGDEVSDAMLLALGDKLGLPREFILYVGTGDTRRISAAARPDFPDDLDLIRWTLDLVEGGEHSQQQNDRL